MGFGTSIGSGAVRWAGVKRLDIRYYDVMYGLGYDVEKALKVLFEPSYVEVIDGRAEVRAVFSGGKKEKVAGVYVTEGKVNRGVSVRVRRGEKVVVESVVSSLRRFKDDVKEVASGYECGVGVQDFVDFEIGDILDFFRREKAG